MRVVYEDPAPACENAKTVRRKNKMEVEGLDVFYGEFHALRDVTVSLPDRSITALIGVSGSGKTTFLRCLNRLHDFSPTARVTGTVMLDSMDIYSNDVDPARLRRRIGMLFQFPSSFKKSIYENVAYSVRLTQRMPPDALDQLVERSLREAALWSEVKGVLKRPGSALSGGQLQRLCIARVLAAGPEVLLMDEPTSQLDPFAAAKIETLLRALRERYAIVIVTHSLHQARRIADFTVFFESGDVVEWGPTEKIFSQPVQRKTAEFVSGRYG